MRPLPAFFHRLRDSFRSRPWSFVVVPVMCWVLGVPIALDIFEYRLTDALSEITLIMFVLGAILLAGIGGTAAGLARNHQPEMFDPDDMDTPVEAIPPQLRKVWRQLSKTYDSESFASRLVMRAEPGSSSDDLIRLAAEEWPAWQAVADRPERDARHTARHEAAHAVVGMALGDTPLFAVIGADPADEMWGYTRFVLRVPEIPEEDDDWNDARTTAAGIVIERDRIGPARGDLMDLPEFEEEIFAIVSAGRRPAGYSGPMTCAALTAAALEEAERLIEEHRPAIDAVAAALLSDGLVGGQELMQIFREHLKRELQPSAEQPHAD